MRVPGWLKSLVGMGSNLHVWLYRMSGGVIGGRFRGCPVALLTTVGRRSGRRITRPLFYLEDGGRYYVVASFMGSDREPAWWTNLKSTPRGRLEVGWKRFDVEAGEASADVHQRLWQRFVAMYRDYEAYQRNTSRRIPLVELRPVSGKE